MNLEITEVETQNLARAETSASAANSPENDAQIESNNEFRCDWASNQYSKPNMNTAEISSHQNSHAENLESVQQNENADFADNAPHEAANAHEISDDLRNSTTSEMPHNLNENDENATNKTNSSAKQMTPQNDLSSENSSQIEYSKSDNSAVFFADALAAKSDATNALSPDENLPQQISQNVDSSHENAENLNLTSAISPDASSENAANEIAENADSPEAITLANNADDENREVANVPQISADLNASREDLAKANSAQDAARASEVSRDDVAELARSYAPDYVFLEDLKQRANADSSGAVGFLERRRQRKIEEATRAQNAETSGENASDSANSGAVKAKRAQNFHDKSRERRERHARKRAEKNLNLRRDDVWQSERLPLTFAARMAIRLAPLYGAFYDWQMTRGGGVREIRQRLSLPRFPVDAAPLKIAFISDFHYGPTSGRTAARQAWKIARDSRPDVLLLGGDFLYADERGLPALLRELQRWKRDMPPGGMFACLGNHDYEAGADTLVMALEACGVRVLINQSAELPEPWRGVHIVGSDDEWHGEAEPDKVIAQLPENACPILLAHSPDVCEHDAIRHCDLAMCGHTHGGQICLPGGEAPHLPAGWVKDFPWGLHRHAGTWLFVSRGVGTVFFPLRVFAPPDVAIFELNRDGIGRKTNATN